jgi:hypothetical protein
VSEGVVLVPFLEGASEPLSWLFFGVRRLILLFFAMSEPNVSIWWMNVITWCTLATLTARTQWLLQRKNIKSHHSCTFLRTLLSERSQNSGQKSQWDSLRFVYTEKPIVDDAGRRRPASSILARMIGGRQLPPCTLTHRITTTSRRS